jgi:PAS domain S-box-containing protein
VSNSFAIGATPSRPFRYGVAALAVYVACSVLHAMLGHYAVAPASLFLCAIAVSAWFGGTGPALLAVVLSFLSFDYFFTLPHNSFAIAEREQLRMAFFLLTALFIGGLAAAQKAAVRATQRANDRLQLEIAERERMHEQLQFMETLLREGQRIGRTGSWQLCLHSKELVWSEEHYRIFGYPPDTDKPGSDIFTHRVHPDDYARVCQIVEEAFARNERFECEYRIVLPHDDIRHVRGIGCPVFVDKDCADRYVGITADITEQRKTEDLLRQREQEFRTLAENSPDGVIRYDRHCRRVYVNPAQIRAMGMGFEEVVNVDLAQSWHADIPVNDYRRAVQRVLDTGERAELEGQWTRPDGTVICFAVHMVAERSAKGEIESVLAISRNITSIKQAEQRLKESQMLLRQLADRSETVREEERKHLARELHDELAQHLSALRMQIYMLRHVDATHDMAEKATVMTGLVDAAIDMVRQVITTLRPVALDMGILSALQWLADDFITQKRIRCILHVDRGSFELSDRSATAIFRIAQESLRNIARHAEATEVQMALWQKDEECFLEITDNGKGFDSTVKKDQSFGLIGIRERAFVLGGAAEITSTPSDGTTVRVCVPAVA